MATLADILGGSQLTQFLGGYQNNPAWQQAQIQVANQQPLNQAAWNAYNQSTAAGAVPQQGVAGFDPTRMAGIQSQIGAAQGMGAQLAGQGAGTLGTIQGGAGAGQDALQRIAGGQGPQFDNGTASAYQNFMNPSMLGAQQALNNQANMAWNKGAANIGGGAGGFMNSGRNAAEGQAKENAATSLGANQQMLAYQAAQQAAQAGQQSGLQGYQGQLQAGNALGNQALQGAQLTGALQQAQLMPGATQEAAGAQFQNQAQNQLNAQYQNQMNQFNNPFKSLQNLQAGLGVLGSGTNAANINMPNNLLTGLNMMGYGNVSNLGNAASTLGGALGSAFNNLLSPAASSIGNTIGGWLNGGSTPTGTMPTVDTAAQMGQGFADYMGSPGTATVDTAAQMGQGLSDWLAAF